MKTNAARLLNKLGISHQILSYEVDPADLAAESTAQKVGLPPEPLNMALSIQLFLKGVETVYGSMVKYLHHFLR